MANLRAVGYMLPVFRVPARENYMKGFCAGWIVHRWMHALQPSVASNLRQTEWREEDRRVKKLNEILMSSHLSDLDSALDRSGVRISPEIVQKVMKSFNNVGFLAFRFFRWAAKQEGYGSHSAESYDLAVDSLGRAKHYDLMWSLVDEMHKKGLLRRETFYLIIRRYARARKPEMAVKAFEIMQSYGFKHDLESFNKLLRSLCKKRAMHKAQEVFEKMKEESSEVYPDLRSYSIMLDGWAQLPQLEKAKKIFKEMQESGLELDNVSFGLYLRALCNGGKVDDALTMFREMQSKGFKHDPHNYSILIHNFGDKQRLDCAMSLFKEMKVLGIVPEIHTCNALVGALCNVGKFKEAYDLLEKENIIPNSRTCNLILHYLIKLDKREEAYLEFWKMAECGRDLDLNTYMMIVKTYLKDGNVDMAMRTWGAMISKGLCPTMHSYCDFINGLRETGNWSEACYYFEEMIDKGIRPFSKTFNRLREGLLKQHMEDKVAYLLEKKKQLANENLLKDIKFRKPLFCKREQR